MIPAEANLRAAANGYDQRTITIEGYASASGVTATVELRALQSDAAELYLTLTSGDGLTVTSDGADLSIAWEITEAQLDTLRAALAADGRSQAHYSLKVERADGVTLQYLYGTYTPIRTATA
jgi:hypothetical protein